MKLSKYLLKLADTNDCDWVKVCKSLNKDQILAMLSNGTQFFIPVGLYDLPENEIKSILNGKVLKYSCNPLTELERWCAEKVSITKINRAEIEVKNDDICLTIYTTPEIKDLTVFALPQNITLNKKEVYNLIEYGKLILDISRLEGYKIAKEK